MDVILLEKITNLGQIGELVHVKPGYGRNYLIPRGKAVPATEDNRAKFDARRAELEKTADEALAAAEARRDQLQDAVVTIAAHAGDEGKLFGSVGTADIAEAFTQAGMHVEKQEVRLPTGALRQAGEHEVSIHLHPDVDAKVVVSVVPEA